MTRLPIPHIIITYFGFLAFAQADKVDDLPDARPDIILEFLNLTEEQRAKRKNFVSILNLSELNQSELGALVEKLKPDRRLYVVSWDEGGKRNTSAFEIEDNSILIESGKGYRYVVTRPMLFKHMMGELTIHWDKWSAIQRRD